MWANPNSVLGGSIAHLASKVLVSRDQDPRHLRLMSPRQGVHPRCIPNLVMVDSTGKAGHKVPVRYTTKSR